MPKRALQMWVIVVLCIAIFAALAAAIPGLTWPLYWKVMVAAIISTALCIFVFGVWLRGLLGRRDQAMHFLDRITAGDLSFPSSEIAAATRSPRMSDALRALVVNLERTIRRFSQLATDVAEVSRQISGRTRVLAASSTGQLESSQATAVSVTQIDASINSVRASMEELSANAEETAASILQMSASIEEVSRTAETLSEFVEQTATAIDQMIASINQVAANTEGFSSFATETASSMVEMNATSEQIGKSARQSAELAGFVKQAASEGREAGSGTVQGM